MRVDFLQRAEHFGSVDRECWKRQSDSFTKSAEERMHILREPSQDLSQFDFSKKPKSFAELSQVSFTNVKIDKLGTIKVLSDGKWISLDKMTQLAIDLLKKNPDFSQEERSHGKKLASRIDWAYRNYDHYLVPAMSGIDKIIIAVRSFFDRLLEKFSIRTTAQIRRDWNGTAGAPGFKHRFFLYTSKQYAETFPAPDYEPKQGEGFVMEEINPEYIQNLSEKYKNGSLTLEQTLFTALIYEREYFEKLLLSNRSALNANLLSHLLILAAKHYRGDTVKMMLSNFSQKFKPQAFVRAHGYCDDWRVADEVKSAFDKGYQKHKSQDD